MTDPADPTTPPPKRRKSGCLRIGCGVALLLGVAFCGMTGLRLMLPRQLAVAAHEKIRPGMAQRDVIAATEKAFLVNGSDCSAGAESFRMTTPGLGPSGHLSLRRAGGATPEEESLSFANQAERLRLFDDHAGLRTCRKLWLVFHVSGVPPRSSFSVELDDHGRVVRTTAPRTWD